jgi:HEAT repeat protein
VRTTLAALLLALAGAGGAAQEPAAVLEEVQRQYEALGKHRDLVGVRLADRALERLATLAAAPERVREDACLFLERILRQPDSTDLYFRLRVTAARVIGLLSGHPARTETLVKLATRPGSSSADDGLDVFVERALGQVRTAAQVAWLLDRLDGTDRAALRLALGGLARMETEGHFGIVRPHVHRILALAADDDPEIRCRAVLLLGRVADDATLPALLRAGQDAEMPVRLAAAEALGHKLDRPGVDAVLARCLEDPSARVREEAVIAFRRAPDRGVIPVLVGRLAREPLRLRAAIAETLKAITGLDFGPEAKPWEEWMVSARAAKRLFDAGPDRPPGGRSRYANTYYGLPVLSDRILFVIDVSGSMAFHVAGRGVSGQKGNTSRLEVARAELSRTLKSLDSRTEFNILVFSDSVLPWKRRGLLKGTKDNLAVAQQFVAGLRASGGTNSYGALEEAFRDFPTIDTVYFLSDGSPTVGPTFVHERILLAVHRWNRLRGVRIHAIALLAGDAPTPDLAVQDDEDDAARFMAALARETGGTYLRRE